MTQKSERVKIDEFLAMLAEGIRCLEPLYDRANDEARRLNGALSWLRQAQDDFQYVRETLPLRDQRGALMHDIERLRAEKEVLAQELVEARAKLEALRKDAGEQAVVVRLGAAR